MLLVTMKKAFSFERKTPNPLVIHLQAVLDRREWLEFKPLFSILLNDLRASKAAHGSEEMLRLRAYNALQEFVRFGVAEKVGTKYRGVLAAAPAAAIEPVAAA
jgi:hypothetical protein